MFSKLNYIIILLNIFTGFFTKSIFFSVKLHSLKRPNLILYNYKHFNIFKFFEILYRKFITKNFFVESMFDTTNFKWFFFKFYATFSFNIYSTYFKNFFLIFKNSYYRNFNNRVEFNIFFLKTVRRPVMYLFDRFVENNLLTNIKPRKKLRYTILYKYAERMSKRKFYNWKHLYTKSQIRGFKELRKMGLHKNYFIFIMHRAFVRKRRNFPFKKKWRLKSKRRRNKYFKKIGYFFKRLYFIKNFFNTKLKFVYNLLFLHIFLKIKKKLRKGFNFFKYFLTAKDFLKKRYKNKNYYCIVKKTRSNSFLTVIDRFGDVIFYFSAGKLNLVTKKYKRSYAAIRLFWPLLVKRLKMFSIKNIILLLSPSFKRSMRYIVRYFRAGRIFCKYIPIAVLPHNNILNTKKLRRVKRK